MIELARLPPGGRRWAGHRRFVIPLVALQELHSMTRSLAPVALVLVFAAITACSEQKPAAPAAAPAPTNSKATPDKGAKQFPAVGVITKIDTKLNSIELDHEKIEGLMPAMKMEWYVKDKALMNGIKVGDKVDFTVEEGGGRQYIVAIKPRS